jgi:hypothetical protein
VSPNNPNLIEIIGRYAECPSCHAPDCDPRPERWPLTVRGLSASCEITPHLPTCNYLHKVRKGGPA